MQASNSKYVLLLSSHAIPVGTNFFKNTLVALKSAANIAGVRYINSIENYKRAIQNDFEVTEPLKYGLMAGCCIVNREIWEQHKFNENLVFSEDKEWSDRVVKKGFKILDINETFFYFISRDQKALLNRFKNETIAEYQFSNNKFHSPLHSLASFFKKIFITNSIVYFRGLRNDLLMLKTKIEIHRTLRKDLDN
jgi:rhamnosyltransferase